MSFLILKSCYYYLQNQYYSKNCSYEYYVFYLSIEFIIVVVDKIIIIIVLIELIVITTISIIVWAIFMGVLDFYWNYNNKKCLKKILLHCRHFFFFWMIGVDFAVKKFVNSVSICYVILFIYDRYFIKNCLWRHY